MSVPNQMPQVNEYFLGYCFIGFLCGVLFTPFGSLCVAFLTPKNTHQKRSLFIGTNISAYFYAIFFYVAIIVNQNYFPNTSFNRDLRVDYGIVGGICNILGLFLTRYIQRTREISTQRRIEVDEPYSTNL